MIIKPIFCSGANTAERAPAKIFMSLLYNLCQTSYFSPSEMLLCHIATSCMPNFLAIRCVNCDASAISGAKNKTFLPESIVSFISLK